MPPDTSGFINSKQNKNFKGCRTVNKLCSFTCSSNFTQAVTEAERGSLLIYSLTTASIKKTIELLFLNNLETWALFQIDTAFT